MLIQKTIAATVIVACLLVTGCRTGQIAVRSYSVITNKEPQVIMEVSYEDTIRNPLYSGSPRIQTRRNSDVRSHESDYIRRAKKSDLD